MSFTPFLNSDYPRRGQPSAAPGMRSTNNNGSNNDTIGSSASNPVVLDDDSEDEVEILEAGSETSRNSTAGSPRPSSPAISPPPLVRLRPGMASRFRSGPPSQPADDSNTSGRQYSHRDAPSTGSSRWLPAPRYPPARSRLRTAPLPPAPLPLLGLSSSILGMGRDEPDWMALGERELDAIFFDASDSESDEEEGMPLPIPIPQPGTRLQAEGAPTEQANLNRSR